MCCINNKTQAKQNLRNAISVLPIRSAINSWSIKKITLCVSAGRWKIKKDASGNFTFKKHTCPLSRTKNSFRILQVLQLPTHGISASWHPWTFTPLNTNKFHTTSRTLSATPTGSAATSPTPALHASYPASTKQLGHPSSWLPTPCQRGIGDASTLIKPVLQHFQLYSRCSRKFKWLLTLEKLILQCSY